MRALAKAVSRYLGLRKRIQPYCALCHNPIMPNTDKHVPLWWCKIRHPDMVSLPADLKVSRLQIAMRQFGR